MLQSDVSSWTSSQSLSLLSLIYDKTRPNEQENKITCLYENLPSDVN